ncbi:hypothetical protein D3C76_355740 [compost metagenome]
MRELTILDAELVSGAVGPGGAAIGAVSAAAGYVGYAAATGEGSFTGLVGNVALGAAVGFVTGPASASVTQAGANTIVYGQVSMYGGMVGGYIENSLNAAGTNYNAVGSNYD